MVSVIFLSTTYMQLRSNYILANLRKEKGSINSYKIPRGELFEYVSSPLQFTEIILYTCLLFILRSSVTYYFVYLWVFVNQVNETTIIFLPKNTSENCTLKILFFSFQTSCAIFAQDWYHKTFKNYPKSRRIVFPYLF